MVLVNVFPFLLLLLVMVGMWNACFYHTYLLFDLPLCLASIHVHTHTHTHTEEDCLKMCTYYYIQHSPVLLTTMYNTTYLLFYLSL